MRIISGALWPLLAPNSEKPGNLIVDALADLLISNGRPLRETSTGRHYRKIGRNGKSICVLSAASGTTTRQFNLKGLQHAFVERFSQDMPPFFTLDRGMAARLNKVVARLGPEFAACGDGYDYLNIADLNDNEFSNPLWTWLALAICTQANVAPPAWVWIRLFAIANTVLLEAMKGRKPSKKGDEANHKSVEAFTEIPDLMVTQEHAQQFHQAVSDLRLALQVHRLLGTKVKLTAACVQVAKHNNVYTRTHMKKVNWRYVYGAYHRWFYGPSCILMLPFARNYRN
jgi:hypothetical protein